MRYGIPGVPDRPGCLVFRGLWRAARVARALQSLQGAQPIHCDSTRKETPAMPRSSSRPSLALLGLMAFVLGLLVAPSHGWAQG